MQIEKFGKTCRLMFVETAYKIAKETIDLYSSKYSKKKFTLQQHAAVICLKIRHQETYKEVVEMLVEEPRVRNALDLVEVPHPFTLCQVHRPQPRQSNITKTSHKPTLQN